MFKAFKAEISEDWASSVDEYEVFKYNQSSSEDLLQEVNIQKMGGLVVELSSIILCSREYIEHSRSINQVVDLSAGKPAVETNTTRLIVASIESLGSQDELTQQLTDRNNANTGHGLRELWYLPLDGVNLIDTEVITTT